MIEEFKDTLAKFDGTTLPIAFADIEFSFPEGTRYPNLFVKHESYGLINPLKGRTVATIAEIDLALRLNATIKYIDAYVAKTTDTFVFREHLKSLIDARNQAKKDGNELMQQLLKLYVNTLYGKVAQGINPKTGFDVNFKGVSTKDMGPSPITQPYFAAMITGTLRAGLSSLLVAIDELNQEGHDYTIISATTDGMLYGLSSKADVSFKDVFKNCNSDDMVSCLKDKEVKFKPFKDVDPILYNKSLEFPALRLLKNSREAWGYNEFLEIKHAANRVLNIKTRGQIGYYDVS